MIITMLITTTEECERAQCELFGLGYSWSRGGTMIIQFTTPPEEGAINFQINTDNRTFTWGRVKSVNETLHFLMELGQLAGND